MLPSQLANRFFILLFCTCHLVCGASNDAQNQSRGTNATYVADAPEPPTIVFAEVPDHNLSAPTVDYKNAVISEADERMWVKQMHFKENGEIKVHRSNFSEIWEDTEHNWISIRADTSTSTTPGTDPTTTAVRGGGVCLLLPLAAPQPTTDREGRRRRRRGRHLFRHKRSEPVRETTLQQHAAFSLASLTGLGHSSDASYDRETFVALQGPIVTNAEITGPRIQRLCRDLDIYVVEKIPHENHEHRERNIRRTFKTVMRMFGWLWNNRRILGLPFGVQGPIYVR